MNYSQLKTAVAACLVVLACGMQSCNKNQAVEDAPTQNPNTNRLKTITNYDVPVGTNIDHGNVAVTGSLAKAMYDHPGTSANPSQFTLTSTGYYLTNSTTAVPAYATLKEGAGKTATIFANSSFAGGTLLMVKSYATVQDIDVNANYETAQVVQVLNTTGVRVTRVNMQASQKLVGANSYCLYIRNSTDVVVDGSTIRRASAKAVFEVS